MVVLKSPLVACESAVKVVTVPLNDWPSVAVMVSGVLRRWRWSGQAPMSVRLLTGRATPCGQTLRRSWCCRSQWRDCPAAEPSSALARRY